MTKWTPTLIGIYAILYKVRHWSMCEHEPWTSIVIGYVPVGGASLAAVPSARYPTPKPRRGVTPLVCCIPLIQLSPNSSPLAMPIQNRSHLHSPCSQRCVRGYQLESFITPKSPSVSSYSYRFSRHRSANLWIPRTQYYYSISCHDARII